MPPSPALQRWTLDDLDAGAAEAFAGQRAGSAAILGDANMALERFPEGIVQTCVTSPPYWFVRDYGIEGQLGLEADLDAFIHSLVALFRRLRRVTRDDGTLWLNIGDGYSSGGRTWRAPDRKNRNRAMGKRPPTPAYLKAKDLLGVPWRLAMALQRPWLGCASCGAVEHEPLWGTFPRRGRICPTCASCSDPETVEAGWYLRSECIWYRPNCQPESVKDRPTRSHEHLFLFSKGTKYRYDHQSVRGTGGRNLRTVWSIHTKPGQHGHIAPFPEGLVDPCVRLTSVPGDIVIDPFMGSATTGVVAHRLGRRFLGVELNEGYLQAGLERMADAGADQQPIAGQLEISSDPA